MGCTITSGITINCDSLKRVGGLNSALWLFNISDLATPINSHGWNVNDRAIISSEFI